MKIRLLPGKILVKQDEAENKFSFIELPDSVKDKKDSGVIANIGLQDSKDNPTLSIGDKIIFGKYSGKPIKLEDTTYLLMSRSDIIAVVRKGNI